MCLDKGNETFLHVLPRPYLWMPAYAGMTCESHGLRHSRESGNPGSGPGRGLGVASRQPTYDSIFSKSSISAHYMPQNFYATDRRTSFPNREKYRYRSCLFNEHGHAGALVIPYSDTPYSTAYPLCDRSNQRPHPS